LDDTQGNIPSALAEKPDELPRTPCLRSSLKTPKTKLAEVASKLLVE
jgi:hypothetical protein